MHSCVCGVCLCNISMVLSVHGYLGKTLRLQRPLTWHLHPPCGPLCTGGCRPVRRAGVWLHHGGVGAREPTLIRLHMSTDPLCASMNRKRTLAETDWMQCMRWYHSALVSSLRQRRAEKKDTQPQTETDRESYKWEKKEHINSPHVSLEAHNKHIEPCL